VTGEITASQTFRTAGIERPVLTAHAPTPALPKLSMNEMTTYRWSLLEDVTGYRDAGIGGIGIWRAKLAEFGEELGVNLIHESGLAVSSVSWAGGFTGANGHSYRESVADARDAIRVAADLNAQCLVIVSGSRAGHTTRHAQRLLVDALSELGDTAAEYDLCLALQPMHPMFELEWTFLTTLDETFDILNRCSDSPVQLAFDVYHLWQEPRLLERIPEIAPRTATVQLSDWREPTRSENDRSLPGEGKIPLPEIVNAFLSAGYGGYFEIEVWSEELWNSDYVDLLDRCRLQFDAIFARESE